MPFIFFFTLTEVRLCVQDLLMQLVLPTFNLRPAGVTELMVEWVLRRTDLSESFCCMCEEDLV